MVVSALDSIRHTLGLPDDVCAVQFMVREGETTVTAYHRRSSGEVDLTEVPMTDFVPALTPAQLTFEWGSIELRTGVVRDAAGEVLNLSRRESQILRRLALNVGGVVSHADLLDVDELLGSDPQLSRVWIHRIRKAIGDVDKRHIVGHSGVGYRLVRGAE